jgi:tetratricopeptide (TPR) repeat protein
VKWSDRFAAWAVLAAAGVAISFLRPAVAGRFRAVAVTGDVYALPSPEQSVVASLGHRSALADYLFGTVLVQYGLHVQEKRRFEFVGDYLDTINALDPTFRDPYRYADSVLILQSEAAREQDYDRARIILERATKNRPYDTELWLQRGQFLAYLAAPHLKDPAKAKAWKTEGGRALAHACELASNNRNLPYHCITAAHLLEAVGEREAAIDSIRRTLAVNDDPAIQELGLGYLRARLSEREKDRQERRRTAFRDATKDLPFVSKDALLILGPRPDTARCAGLDHPDDVGCVTSWLAWAAFADPTE